MYIDSMRHIPTFIYICNQNTGDCKIFLHSHIMSTLNTLGKLQLITKCLEWRLFYIHNELIIRVHTNIKLNFN